MQAPPAPPKRGPNKLLIAGVVIVAVVVLLAVVGVMMLNASANANAKNTAEQMTLKQSDFPSGWHASGTSLDLDTAGYDGVEWSYTVFNNSVTGDPLEARAEVSCQIITYNSVADAKADFAASLENGDYTFNEVSGHFDQCQVWSVNYPNLAVMKMYAFQEKNVVGVLTFSSYFDSEMSQAWIDDILDAQENRIV
jgi:hypothetical protein